MCPQKKIFKLSIEINKTHLWHRSYSTPTSVIPKDNDQNVIFIKLLQIKNSVEVDKTVLNTEKSLILLGMVQTIYHIQSLSSLDYYAQSTKNNLFSLARFESLPGRIWHMSMYQLVMHISVIIINRYTVWCLRQNVPPFI